MIPICKMEAEKQDNLRSRRLQNYIVDIAGPAGACTIRCDIGDRRQALGAAL